MDQCWETDAPAGQARYRDVYRVLVGPIPEDCELDHLCGNGPGCYNPRHLEAVTHQENCRRARTLCPEVWPHEPRDEAAMAWRRRWSW